MLEEAVAAEDARHEAGEGGAEGAGMVHDGESPTGSQPAVQRGTLLAGIS